jgi:hypothetical protein
MKCDLEMLNNAYNIWNNRFIFGDTKLLIDDQHVSIENNIEFDKDSILPESIDFHCTDILNIISKKYKQYNYNILKECIWHNNSKFNKRNLDDKIPNNLIDIWKHIKEMYYKLTHEKIFSLF